MWVFPGGVPLSLALHQQVYNLLEVRCFHQSFKFRPILPLLKIVSLANLFFVEGYPFSSNVHSPILHSHHVSIELFYYIYKSRRFMLTEELPSLAFDNLCEWRNPLVETSFPNEVSVLEFVLLSDIGQIRDPITNFLFATLCFFISSFPFSRFFHCLLKFFIYLSSFFTLPCYYLSGLNYFILQLSIFFHYFVEVWNHVCGLRHRERKV